VDDRRERHGWALLLGGVREKRTLAPSEDVAAVVGGLVADLLRRYAWVSKSKTVRMLG
jgi:hypothetical protein